MRIVYIILWFSLYFFSAQAQVTLVQAFPTDTINLSCSRCSIEITEMALTKGQQSIPINLDKPVKTNLLHWKYFDEVSKEEVTMEERPVWTEGKQLVDDLLPEEAISLHINLRFTDSLDQTHRIFLVMSGINKQNLLSPPLETTFDPDTYAIFRFSAIYQTTNQETLQKETFDSTDGTCILDVLDLKKGKYSGTFSFLGSRVGLEQESFFMNGIIKK